MKVRSATRYETLPSTDSTFQSKKFNLIVRVLVISSIVIFVIETLLMIVLEYYLQFDRPFLVLIDGVVLISFLVPINYFLLVKPMTWQVEEHQRTNQELLRSSELLERFFSISDVLIAYLDANFDFIRVNQAYAAADERTPEEFIGKNHFALYPSAENLAIFQQVVQTGQPYSAQEKTFTYTQLPERGATYWDWSVLPVKSPNGKVYALILVMNNVTDRKKAQIALQSSERRFRAVFNQAYQHSGLLDPNGKVILLNQANLEFTRMSQSEATLLPLWKLPWWEADPELQHRLQTAVHQAASGAVVHLELPVHSASGNRAIMDITLKSILNELGEPALLIFEARDITHHIRSEESLKRREAEIERLYEAEQQAHLFADTLRSAVLAISESLDSETVLETLLDHLQHVIPYSSAHILLLQDEDLLVVRMARGEESWEDPLRLSGKRFETAEYPFLQPLLQRREILSVPDTLLYPGAIFQPEGDLVRCWLGIPLLAGEQVVGICILEHFCPGFFTGELIHWATALTGQAAVAIQNAWLFEQVRDGREHLLALSRRLVEVQEMERLHIARELHDEAGQALAGLMIGLRQMERENSEDPGVVVRCQELKSIADSVLENLHRLAIDLRPATLDHMGLVAALRQHAESISHQHGITVQFESVGNIERLPGDLETAVYRIVQEALTNVIRHACASRVDILLELRGKILVIVVEDNGIGFDTESDYPDHLGLVGMRERANMLGGTLIIESAPGKGATVQLEVPCLFES